MNKIYEVLRNSEALKFLNSAYEVYLILEDEKDFYGSLKKTI